MDRMHIESVTLNSANFTGTYVFKPEPMETAKRDGSRVLLVFKSPNQDMATCFWCKDCNVWEFYPDIGSGIRDGHEAWTFTDEDCVGWLNVGPISTID